jgi:hypothetical protein
MQHATDTIGGLRRLLGGILLLGMSGTFVELLLLKHDEDRIQLVPLVLLGSGVAAVTWHWWRRSGASAAIVRVLMVLFMAAGAAGVYYHFAANVEFQREIDPALRGRALVWQALQAKAPPALAPGVMLQLGLIGLAYTYGHKGALRQ